MEHLLKKTLFLLKPEQFPEIHAFLSDCKAGVITPTCYEMVDKILCMDKPEPFPSFLNDFVAALYDWEISNGNVNAMNDLGTEYYEGYRGFEQNFEKAIHYYKMAADHGNRQALENLGYCYYYGRAGEPDYEKAFHYFALGAFDGHLISLYKIGDMYLNGLYVEKNEVEAFHIYMHCIRMMSKDAERRIAGPVYLRLGKMMLDGIGVDQDLRGALLSFHKAELYLYDMVMNGEVMYKKSLQDAIEG